MGRPVGTAERKRKLANTLRIELEKLIERGQCVYCRAPASPHKPLTREHVIPRARGGRRNDVRIIVPACERCNQHRGCRDLIPFLLSRPQRISSFLDHLTSLSAESVRELDLRIFAELYTAIAILQESATYGDRWRSHLERLCTGRSLHRRRYATRRAVGALTDRMESLRGQEGEVAAASCTVTAITPNHVAPQLEEPLENLAARIVTVLSLLWQVPSATVKRELARELNGAAAGWDETLGGGKSESGTGESNGIVALDGWKARRPRKRVRVDRRGGGGRQQRFGRGRAA